MRITGGGYSLHQSLTVEAAAIIKQAVSLARRRGHAQVTPLHVAIAMLSSPTTGFLNKACLQSHSHPLQFKALDFCFNVALNRLHSASSTPLMAPHSTSPSLSNALVAAFKRAQAHQRRGSMESVTALTVEIQQLVISVLDDPSVSRVMREAGFSSTQVKNNVEQSNDVVSHQTIQTTTKTTSLSHFRFSSLGRKVSQSELNDDAKCKIGSPSLETLWSLHSLESPDTNLALTLGLDQSVKKSEAVDDRKCLLFDEKGDIKNLYTSASSSKLPSWLQQYKDENAKQTHIDFLAAVEKPDLLSNPNSSPNSASSSEDSHYTMEHNSDKLNMLRETLEEKIPSQRHIIPDIVSTILKCRSRNVRQESWMFFLGAEGHDKVTIARELAKAVFGSYDCYTSIGISGFSTRRDREDSAEEEGGNSRKRAREENDGSLYNRFAEAVSHNPSRVFYVEDADRVDCCSLKGLKKAMKEGSVSVCDGGVVQVRDAIVIFSCCDELGEEKQCGLLDLNLATRDDDDDGEMSVGILDLVDHKAVFKMQA